VFATLAIALSAKPQPSTSVGSAELQSHATE